MALSLFPFLHSQTSTNPISSHGNAHAETTKPPSPSPHQYPIGPISRRVRPGMEVFPVSDLRQIKYWRVPGPAPPVHPRSTGVQAPAASLCRALAWYCALCPPLGANCPRLRHAAAACSCVGACAGAHVGVCIEPRTCGCALAHRRPGEPWGLGKWSSTDKPPKSPA